MLFFFAFGYAWSSIGLWQGLEWERLQKSLPGLQLAGPCRGSGGSCSEGFAACEGATGGSCSEVLEALEVPKSSFDRPHKCLPGLVLRLEEEAAARFWKGWKPLKVPKNGSNAYKSACWALLRPEGEAAARFWKPWKPLKVPQSSFERLEKCLLGLVLRLEGEAAARFWKGWKALKVPKSSFERKRKCLLGLVEA